MEAPVVYGSAPTWGGGFLRPFRFSGFFRTFAPS